KHPLVLGEPEAYSRKRVEEVFHQHDLVDLMLISAETTSDEYTPTCVRAGMGIGIGVGIASSPLYQDLEVRSLRRWFGTARIGFLWRRGTIVPPLQRELATLLSEGLS